MLGMIVLDRFVFFPDRDHAGMRRLADHMLQLDRRVLDTETPPQLLVDLTQNRVAFRCRHVGNLHVRRKRMILLADAPDMQIMNVADAGNRSHRRLDLFQTHSSRSALKQNVQSLAYDPET